MSIIYTGKTASTYYRLAAAGLLPAPHYSQSEPLASAYGGMQILRGVGLPNKSLSAADLAQRGIYSLCGGMRPMSAFSDDELESMREQLVRGSSGYVLPRPLDVLVLRKGRRSISKGSEDLRVFVCGADLPSSCFRSVGNDEYLPSPELLFLQMAQVESRIHLLAAFGCELTGSYALLPRGLISLRRRLGEQVSHDLRWLTIDDLRLAEGYVDCRPRTSVERIRSFLDALPRGVRGIQRARTALRWVRDGSRSPMETASCLSLQLPLCRGGFGLGEAAFNIRVKINNEWQQALRKPYVVVDIVFEGKNGKPLIVEYNGASGHFTKRQILADNQRRHALEAKGARVVFVTARDFYDFATWHSMGEDFARYLGYRHAAPTEAVRAKRLQVHADFCDPLLLR